MPGYPIDRFSYIRATHEVLPTPELVQFLGAISKMGLDEVGTGDNTLVRKKATLDEELSPDFVPLYEVVGLPMVEVSTAASLRVTIFEDRLAKNSRNDKSLKRLLTRLLEVDLDAVRPDRESIPLGLKAAARHLEESLIPQRPGQNREFGLVLEDGPIKRFFQAEQTALYRAANAKVGSTGAEPISREYPDPAFVPVFRIPKAVSEEAVVTLLERIEAAAALAGPLVTLHFDELEWDSKSRR